MTNTEKYKALQEALGEWSEPAIEEAAKIAIQNNIPIIGISKDQEKKDISTILSIPREMLTNGSKLFWDCVQQTYDQVEQGYNGLKQTANEGYEGFIGFCREAILAPEETAAKIEEKIKEIRGFDFAAWARDTFDKSALKPMFENERVVETMNDLKQWAAEVMKKLEGTRIPEFLQEIENGLENTWIAEVVRGEQPLTIDAIVGETQQVAKEIVINLEEVGRSLIEFPMIQGPFDMVERLRDGTFGKDVYDGQIYDDRNIGGGSFEKSEEDLGDISQSFPNR